VFAVLKRFFNIYKIKAKKNKALVWPLLMAGLGMTEPTPVLATASSRFGFDPTTLFFFFYIYIYYILHFIFFLKKNNYFRKHISQ